jgi:cytochrome c-type biogenesis protein
MLSVLSPCVLPLVPIYIGYLTGTTAVRGTPSGAASVKQSPFLHAISFVAGFGLVFVVFGVSLGLVGFLLRDQQDILAKAAGSLMILFGLHLSGIIKIPFLEQERRTWFAIGGDSVGYARSFLIGAAFSVGWSPCIGPTLGAILALAATSGTVLEGGLLLIVYSLGLSIPFLAMGLAFNSAQGVYLRLRPLMPVINFGSGTLIIIVGILIFTGTLINLNQYFNFGLFSETQSI